MGCFNEAETSSANPTDPSNKPLSFNGGQGYSESFRQQCRILKGSLPVCATATCLRGLETASRARPSETSCFSLAILLFFRKKRV